MIDDFDRKILECLKENARVSYKDIGERIGLTPPAVAQRIQKLEASDIIQGYRPILNHEKLGSATKVMILVNLRHQDHGYRFLRETFAKRPEVLSFHRITGEDCIMMKLVFRDNHHLVEFADELEKFGNTKTSIILEEVLN